MSNYRYIGHKRHLIGLTALGRIDDRGRFLVQVDKFTHRYSHGWWVQDSRHWEPYCPGCGAEIDPDVCWCGDWISDHGYFDGHAPAPMGCNCFRQTS